MADTLGTMVGSILIPILIFVVGLTFIKDKKSVAKTLVALAIVVATGGLVIHQFNPIMTYQEASVVIDESMMKDYGHGVKAVDPVKVRIAEQKNKDKEGWTVDVGRNIARTGLELAVIIAMIVTLAVISTKNAKQSKASRGSSNKKSSKKAKTEPKDNFDDGL